MRFQQQESSGTPANQPHTSNGFVEKSLSLPFAQQLPLSAISGPTYVTAQTLVQQVAFSFADKLFTYSPSTFDLDLCAKAWSSVHERNAYDRPTSVLPLETRSGAGSVALGYIFSKDFDLKRRHIPQTVIVTSSTLPHLRSALEQLSLLYSVANPLVAHIAAVSYTGSDNGALAADYATAMQYAEDLGYGLICSRSAYESQHMALLSTLLAQHVPALHVYDGVKMGRETTRVIDVLDQTRLKACYDAIASDMGSFDRKHLDLEGKVTRLFSAFNDHMGTDYKAFEYYGHTQPTAVLVCFGSLESSLTSQIASSLARDNVLIGVITVRMYRPFAEELFLEALPKTAKVVGVLGQVSDEDEVGDPATHSCLFGDVLAALSVNSGNSQEVQELKYSMTHVWNPVSVAAAFQYVLGEPILQENEQHKTLSLQILDESVQQYSFWDLDDSASASTATVLAQALSKDSAQNVTINTTYDNMLEGGVRRSDVRKSPKSIEANFSVEAADTVFVGDEKITRNIDIVRQIKDGGKLILRLPGVKDEDVEKKLSQNLRKSIAAHDIRLYLIDPTKSELPEESKSEAMLIQLGFLRVALPGQEEVGLGKLATIGNDADALQKVSDDLEKTLREIEVPKAWTEEDEDDNTKRLQADLITNSFVPFDEEQNEPPSLLRNWQKAAKGMLFKEAYGTRSGLRPELATKTYTVHVKENRRLTPVTYDRNIFHIEFDLGDSGLTYDIGEALGIHAENDPEQVSEFIKFYGLNSEDVVEVPSREDPAVFENRTVWQALIQNIDIFGRPPKRFYESLADFASDDGEKKELSALGGPEGVVEFQRRAEVDTVTYADILLEFPSAHPSFHDIVQIVAPMKRREYSIASCQKVTPNSVALMVVVVGWVDPQSRDRFGQATRFLWRLKVGTPVTVSIKPSVMKLPPKSTQPLIMAGLGTGLAPFRAFVQHRALEKSQGKEIGSVLLYMGSRHQREEYCYGEEWEAYQDAGVITLLGRAFSRDQPQKIYIQDRMRQTMSDIIEAYIKEEGAFYLCGPTWPVPDVTNVLQEAIAANGKAEGRKVDSRKEIEKLKDEGRYVLEVY
ncbi:MAG: hypothetical protein Q9160_005680 [Pyrenula sp. 1 TL-2023]